MKFQLLDEWCNHNSFAAAVSNENVSVTVKPGVEYEGNITNLMNKCLKNPDERIWNPTSTQAFSDSDRLGTAIARNFGESKKYYTLTLDSEKIIDGLELVSVVVNKKTGETFAGSSPTDYFKDFNYGDITYKAV